MRNFYSVLTIFIIAISMSSCASYKMKTYDYIYINKQGVIQKPVVAELEVNNQKVHFSQTYTNMSIEEAKEHAMVEIIKSNNADLLVHPMYSIDASQRMLFSANKWALTKIELSGYPAVYKNMRTYQAKDAESFQVNAQINNEANKPIESVNERKPNTLKKILTYGGGALLILTLLAGVAG
jgi:hypothetical protein